METICYLHAPASVPPVKGPDVHIQN